MDRQRIYAAIDKERQHQIDKYGADKQQSLPGFLVILRRELAEAEEGWIKNHTGRNSPMNEILQIAAVCVAAMEKYGTSGSATATDDIPDEPQFVTRVVAQGLNSMTLEVSLDK